MSKLVKFDPFAELDSLQKYFFDDDWILPMREVHLPTTDIYTENDKEMIIEAQLPNFKEKDINISVDGDYLVIQANHQESEKDSNKKYIVRESSSSLYRRLFLPERANRENVKAHFEDGVLRVTVPFKELPEAKNIAISTKTSK